MLLILLILAVFCSFSGAVNWNWAGTDFPVLFCGRLEAASRWDHHQGIPVSCVLLLGKAAATLCNFSGAGLGLLQTLFVIISLMKTGIYELLACQ